MYTYFKGIITEIDSGNITIECGGVGYKINVPNPFSYNIGEEYKVYVYTKISEDDMALFGFKIKEEYELFLKLISVKGLGPKLALPIIATGSISGIVDAINRENILYLTKFPKIGEKLARQIILDLKNKINIEGNAETENNSIEELMSVLESLGYKLSEIKKVIPLVNPSEKLENQVKEALKLMLK